MMYYNGHRSNRGEEEETFHGRQCISNFQLTAVTVHPHLQFNSLKLLPLPVLVATAKQAGEVVHGASHGGGRRRKKL